MQGGFTLLEILVTITILTILTYLVASAFPVVRENQMFISAEQQLQSAVRSAQTRALNEQREQACLDQVGSDLQRQRRCSDIGVHVTDNRIITFADSVDDNTYGENDYQISETTLPLGITAAETRTFLFEATPPSVTLFVDGVTIEADSHGEITLQTSRRQMIFNVYPYGQLERQ